jgi:protein-disulfide isomerase
MHDLLYHRQGEVQGTPTLLIDGVVHRGSYDAATLLEALATER